MQRYAITYIDSDDEHYDADGTFSPYMKVGVRNKSNPEVVLPLTIYWPTDESPTLRFDAHDSLNFHEIGAVLGSIEAKSLALVEHGGSELYPSVFYNKETERYDREISFALLSRSKLSRPKRQKELYISIARRLLNIQH